MYETLCLCRCKHNVVCSTTFPQASPRHYRSCTYMKHHRYLQTRSDLTSKYVAYVTNVDETFIGSFNCRGSHAIHTAHTIKDPLIIDLMHHRRHLDRGGTYTARLEMRACMCWQC